MLYDYPTIIVDRFFKDPYVIRDFGLSLKFSNSKEGVFSGTRTDSLHSLYPTFFNEVCTKTLSCFSLNYESYSASLYFHKTGSNFGGTGWVHRDNESKIPGIASIIYLGHDTGESGTSIYKLKKIEYDHNIIDHMSLMRNSFISDNEDLVTDIKLKHNSEYVETVNIGSEFNRMIAYDSKTPHAGNGYYGSESNNMRLVMLCFFHEINLVEKTTPLKSAELSSYL